MLSEKSARGHFSAGGRLRAVRRTVPKYCSLRKEGARLIAFNISGRYLQSLNNQLLWGSLLCRTSFLFILKGNCHIS